MGMSDPFQIYPPDSPKRQAADAYLSADTQKDVNAAAKRIHDLGAEDAKEGREFDLGASVGFHRWRAGYLPPWL